tara:strand:+ start:961 stop:1212 length:252 start_codon:yes stop_codon:yes gene_type:complete
MNDYYGGYDPDEDRHDEGVDAIFPLLMLVGLAGVLFFGLELYREHGRAKPPESESCSVHVPTGTLLVTDELMKFKGGIYRRVK